MQSLKIPWYKYKWKFLLVLIFLFILLSRKEDTTHLNGELYFIKRILEDLLSLSALSLLISWIISCIKYKSGKDIKRIKSLFPYVLSMAIALVMLILLIP